MANKFFFLLVFFVVLFSCGEQETSEVDEDGGASVEVERGHVSGDSLTYRLHTVVRRFEGCDTLRKEEDYCTEAVVAYVEVVAAPSEVVRQRINDSLVVSIIEDDSIPDIEAMLDTFIQEYIRFVRDTEEFNESEGSDFGVPPWNWEVSQKVVNNTPDVFVVEQGLYVYQGGAHGSYATSFLNFSPRTGKLLKLRDLVAPEKMDELRQIAKERFDEVVAEGEWTEEDFWFPEDGFYLPETFGLLPEGLVFVFAIYEIGPYALGELSFVIPYEELGGLAKPYSVLDRLTP